MEPVYQSLKKLIVWVNNVLTGKAKVVVPTKNYALLMPTLQYEEEVTPWLTMCLGGETPKIVSQRLEILKPMVNMMLVQEFAKRHDAPLIVSSRP